MESKFSVLLALLCFLHSLAFQGDATAFESVPDLEKSMYREIEGFPCVRLLNVSGEIGCSNPGRAGVIAPIVRLKDAKEFDGSAAILVSIEELESLFSRLSEDSDFPPKVAGILVESSTRVHSDSKGFSPDVKFPQADFAPYQNNTFQWNPVGSGIMWKGYNFPVFLLSQTSTAVMEEVSSDNEKSKGLHTKVVAEFDLVMQTTKSGNHDSESCLEERTCLPLGGYSVWSALPPINISSSLKVKPVVMAIVSMDTASFFRDQSLGAESPISGLIALLAVVDSLSRLDGLGQLSKQLVFVAFTGEAWGYLGSRRFLLEHDLQSDTVKGLGLDTIDTVMEIGSVGKSSSEGRTFYAHTAGASSSMNRTLQALQSAQISLKTETVTVKPASASNPGVPPSSLMTFISKKPMISGVVLEDFDSSFSNKFYHSHLDDTSNINSSSIVAAASLVARTLYILAGGEDTSVLNDIKVNATLVEELVGCLLSCEPGLSCDLVNHYISPSTTCPNHYVGVILDDPSNPSNVGDISRFIWNFLAEKTSGPSKNASSSCPNNCRGNGEVCIRQETDGKGVCVISTTRYVPAYSTRLKFNSGSWTLLPPNTSYGEDPVWTESNWNTIRLRVFKVQSSQYDHVILILGFVVTLLAYVLIIVARTVIRKVAKQD